MDVLVSDTALPEHARRAAQERTGRLLLALPTDDPAPRPGTAAHPVPDTEESDS